MIDIMISVPRRNWVVTAGRDKCIFVWKLVNHHLIKYAEDNEHTCENSMECDSDENEPSVNVSRASRDGALVARRRKPRVMYDYLVRFETAHKDFMRSVVAQTT